jgi:Na+/proline symporter
MILALIFLVIELASSIDFGQNSFFETIYNFEHSRIFVFDDWHSKQNFFKQFFSGIFIAIVMTGLDQDMMQKNLTCKNIADAKKNMYWYGFSFVPVNLLFLVLGAMLLILASQWGTTLPENPDQILTIFATSMLGNTVLILFIIGIVAAAFSSADSALAALTTSFAVDILGVQKYDAEKAKRIRKKIHIGVALLFAVIILIFEAINDKSVIDAIYTIASYTYGPLLGMFSFGLFSKFNTNDRFTPYIAILSPILCFALNAIADSYFNYKLGYELLMLNGMLTFVGLWLFRTKKH